MPSQRTASEVTSARAGRTPLLFLVLIPVVSLPFYFLGGQALLPHGMPFIPLTSLMVFVPMLLAVALTFRERGGSEVRRLLARAFDARSVRPLWWLLPAFLLLPLALHIAYLLSQMLGNDLGEPSQPWTGSALVLFIFVLLPFAIAEELGWMGYAADPLQERWGTLGASATIGIAWAMWHWLPWYGIFGSVEWVLWQTVLDVLLRVLIFWLYNNTHGSVLLAAIFHASFNVSFRVFPDDGREYDPLATVIVVAAITLLVMVLWGPKTLARYRFARGRAG